jgi:hypothetical protein
MVSFQWKPASLMGGDAYLSIHTRLTETSPEQPFAVINTNNHPETVVHARVQLHLGAFVC